MILPSTGHLASPSNAAATHPLGYVLDKLRVQTTGTLTIPANMTGHPAVSIPSGLTSAGLPVGMQVYGRRHEEALLLDLALIAERERPWPLVATGAPV